MAVMVSFTLKTDVATYQKVHKQMLPRAPAAGMLFHSGHAVGNQVGISTASEIVFLTDHRPRPTLSACR